MNRENLTREEIIEQIADYQRDSMCSDWEFAATDLIIHGYRDLNSYTDDELNEIWDRYFGREWW
jgi:hypothetical protein